MLLKEMSDEDLIFLINAGSELAQMTFYRRYRQYAKMVAKEYYKEFKDSGIQEDEFFAIAFERVQHAIEKYKNIQKKFLTYWKVIVKNAIYDYVRVNSYQGGMKVLSGLSLDSDCYHDSDRYTFHDAIGEKEEENGLKEFLENYLEDNEKTLSDDEKLILRHYILVDHTIEELCEITHLNKARINYLIRTTRNKIQQIIKENYL